MKTTTILLSLFFVSHFAVTAQTTFEIDTVQSMIMTGKGPGQDATISPYFGQDCFAIVKNIGERAFSVRIQQKGEIIKEIPIPKGETKKVKLLKGYELYLDPNPNGMAKASVDYEKMIE